MSAHDTQAGVVRIVDGGGQPSPSDRVVGELVNGSQRSLVAARTCWTNSMWQWCSTSTALRRHHGNEVLQVLSGLHIPSIVIAHTILTNPTPHQRSVLNDVAALADRVVVMTEAARARPCDSFDVDPSKVITIAHGAAIPTRRVVPERDGRPVILTWGLIGPGKGIERAIDAMRTLHDLPMRPRYLVAGQTHPKVLAAHGES